MGFERDLMPFMAIQDLWVGHGPALVVLVDERFPVGADFALKAHGFRRRLLGFRGFLLHLARLSGFLSQREQRHQERERERNQHQFFHSGTPFEWSTLAKRYWSRPSLRSAPAMSGAEDCGFRDATSVLSCDASGQAHAAEWAGVDWFGMAVTVEMHNTGDSVLRSEIIALV